MAMGGMIIFLSIEVFSLVFVDSLLSTSSLVPWVDLFSKVGEAGLEAAALLYFLLAILIFLSSE